MVQNKIPISISFVFDHWNSRKTWFADNMVVGPHVFPKGLPVKEWSAPLKIETYGLKLETYASQTPTTNSENQFRWFRTPLTLQKPKFANHMRVGRIVFHKRLLVGECVAPFFENIVRGTSPESIFRAKGALYVPQIVKIMIFEIVEFFWSDHPTLTLQ